MQHVTMEGLAQLGQVLEVMIQRHQASTIALLIFFQAGIPTIIRPFFGDQFFWADRVEALGIGSCVRKLTVENLTAALITATTDVKQIERAKLVGNAIHTVRIQTNSLVYSH